MASNATPEDAKLLLQLYDLRREKRLRQARDFIRQDCKFKDYKDFLKRYPEGSKENTYIGMVAGYWELACTLVAKGLIDEDLFQATNFEHVGVWFKLKPVFEGWRKQYQYDDIMKNLETIATRSPAAAAYQPEEEKGKGKGKDKNKDKGKDKDSAKNKSKSKPAEKPAEPEKRAKPVVEDEDEDEVKLGADDDDDEDE